MMKKIVLFGAGDFGKRALSHYGAAAIECFADNDSAKIGKRFCGKDVVAFNEIKRLSKEFLIVVASSHFSQMAEQLEAEGVFEYDYYSPIHEKAVRVDWPALLCGAETAVAYGIDNCTAKLIRTIQKHGGACKLAYVADRDDGAHIGKSLEGHTICSLKDAVSVADCFIVTSETFNAALHADLRRKTAGSGARIINPFKKKGFYDMGKVVFNPYESDASDHSESQWNRAVEQDRVIGEVEAYVGAVKDFVPLFDFIEVETINRCNGVCAFCPVSKKMDTREEKTMSADLFKNIVRQLETLDYKGSFSAFSNNEPLLDARIVELSAYAREHLPNARIHMFTNGTLFTLDIFKALIPHLDELIIDNYAKNLRLIKPCREIADYVSEHAELRKKVTIVLRKPDEILTSRGGDAPNRRELVSYSDAKCALPFQQMVVRPDGKVSLCCNDPLGKNTLGDLTKESILDVWYGERYARVREHIARGRKFWEHCMFCDTFYLY